MKDMSFNPFENLGLSQPTILRNGFNSPEVKKAYRSLARKYHPDKLRQLPEEEQAGAAKKWQSIVKSYETLTTTEKFNNWIEYGNPDGSMISQSFDIALPSWMSDPQNKVLMLCLLLVMFVIVPIIIIYFTMDNDPMNVKRYRNGTVKESGVLMLRPLFEILEQNMKKKNRTFSDENFISLLAESVEWENLMEIGERKINLKDVLKSKLNGQKVSEKLKEIDLELESIVPKLISVLMETFADIGFAASLTAFNAQKNSKVSFTVDDLFTQISAFSNRAMRNLENGYKGYEVKFTQLNKDASYGDKHYVEVQVEVQGLDWESIRTEESKEAYENYMKALELFVSFVSLKSNNGLVYKMDSALIKGDKLTQVFKLQVQEAGKHEFRAFFSDCYGVSKKEMLQYNCN